MQGALINSSGCPDNENSDYFGKGLERKRKILISSVSHKNFSSTDQTKL